MAGYSETQLFKKLGIREGFRVALTGAPPNFREELGELPAGVELSARAGRPLNLALLFVKSEAELRGRFPALASALDPAGMLWVAWPKKAAGVPTDLSFEVVQRVGLEAGLVDTKVCAVNEVWSGLRFVYRLKDRPNR